MSTAATDRNLFGSDTDFGGITAAEVVGRGRVHQRIDDNLVALMESRVRKTGILERLQGWRDEDSGSYGIGGRPALISDQAMLTGMLLLAKEGAPLLLTLLSALFELAWVSRRA